MSNATSANSCVLFKPHKAWWSGGWAPNHQRGFHSNYLAGALQPKGGISSYRLCTSNSNAKFYLNYWF